MSILALRQLEAAALVTGYDKELRRRAVLKDIYVNLTGLFKRTEHEIPNAIYFKFDEKALAGANSARVTMKLPLTGPVVPGNNNLMGTEEAPTTKSATVYRNNYKKAVRTEAYGVRYVDQEAYGLYKEHINDLGVWAQQYKGLDIRTCALQTYGLTLWAGDTINLAVPFWHPHVYVAGAGLLNQPAYNPNLTTYTNNIVNSMLASTGNLTPTVAMTFMFRTMNHLVQRALDEKIMPLEIGGQHSYIFVISEHQAAMFGDPTWNTANSAGLLWYDTNRFSDKDAMKWYGVLGMYKSPIGADVYIVVDPKCPTLLPSGTAEPYTLTAGYMWPGDVDLRNRTNPNTRDACMFYGKGFAMEWEPEKLHFIKQDTEYWRIMGNGIAGVRGIQQVHFDQANPTATSIEYYGSILAIMARMDTEYGEVG